MLSFLSLGSDALLRSSGSRLRLQPAGKYARSEAWQVLRLLKLASPGAADLDLAMAKDARAVVEATDAP